MSGEAGLGGGASVGNDLSGTVYGPVVQAGSISGGITFRVEAPPATGMHVVPDEVPPVNGRFINRTADLALLDKLFDADADAGDPDDSEDVRVGALYGPPGVGKTAMASRWAHRSRHRFPDGQLYVDFGPLRARAGGDVSAALAACLRGLGVDRATMPASVEEQAALFRTRSAGRRLLVVLDGVNRPGQVRALLPNGPGSVVLVTGHGGLAELAMRGVRLVPLKPLDAESGVRLLADRCGEEAVARDPQAARQLVELCGGLPEALVVVAARLVRNQHLDMAGLVEELTDETARLAGLSLRGGHSVSAAFALSYADLPPDSARLYRLLGWMPGRTFDAATAACAADVSVSVVEESLESLVEVSLLERTADGRFRFHDLVRLHAQECAAAEEPKSGRRALVGRVTAHYLVLTALADRALHRDRLRIADLSALLAGVDDPFEPGGPDPLAWLEAERANILAVLREAAAYGLHTVVWQLVEAFTALFLRHRHLRDWQEALQLGVDAAVAAMAPAAEARLRSLLSRPLMDLGANEQARIELDKAVACAAVTGDAGLQASVEEFNGRYFDRFDPPEAVAAYRRSITLNVKAKLPRGVAIATFFLGRAMDAQGDHAGALTTLHEAHDALLECGDARMAGRALAAIGRAQGRAGDIEVAARTLAEAAKVLHEQKSDYYQAQALEELAKLLAPTGAERTEVRRHAEAALKIYEAAGSPEADELRAWLAEFDEDADPQ